MIPKVALAFILSDSYTMNLICVLDLGECLWLSLYAYSRNRKDVLLPDSIIKSAGNKTKEIPEMW